MIITVLQEIAVQGEARERSWFCF